MREFQTQPVEQCCPLAIVYRSRDRLWDDQKPPSHQARHEFRDSLPLDTTTNHPPQKPYYRLQRVALGFL